MILTRRVKAAVPSTSEANLPTEEAATHTKGKGKGVGKGCSGSSGPPVKKKKARKPPTASSSKCESSDAEAGEFEMQEVECSENKSMNHLLFSIYNIVKLNLTGCQILYNVDFLQVMSNLI